MKLASLFLCLACSTSCLAQGTITNDTFWDTAEGQPVYSQGGGVFKFGETYYWYGVQYAEAALYRNDPSRIYKQCTFEGVTCYTSTDLTNWSAQDMALKPDDITPYAPIEWLGRMGVAKVDSTYALLIQCNSHLLVCESSSPEGPFKWGHLIDMTPLTGTTGTGDQTVFTDPDTGLSYLVCSRPGGRNRLYVCPIGRNELGQIAPTAAVEVFSGAGREGNCMFKHHGKYYLCASNLYGWDGSYAYFLMADEVTGPYRPVIENYRRPINDYPDQVENDMQVMPGCEADYSHVSQTGFFITVPGSQQELVIFCGDRWADFAGNGLGYNQWMPLSFDGDVPHFNSLSAWQLDAVKGTWAAAPGNNWCLNPSFEADRRTIPSSAKPRQDFLTGWKTLALKGSESGLVLNYDKTRDDRRQTVGEKALLATDTVPFTRRVSQLVRGTHAAPLPDGTYTLQAVVKIMNDGSDTDKKGKVNLTLFATDASGKRQSKIHPLYPEPVWRPVQMDVKVKGGQTEIGFHIQAPAHVKVLIDDVQFTCQEAK